MRDRRIALLAGAALVLAVLAWAAVARPARVEGLDRLPPLRLHEPRLPLPPVVIVPASHDLRSACLPAEGAAPRLIAVSIDNFPAARPQAGLSRACLVYEVPVEGGATRFEAVYGARGAPLVGPVRSVRKYTLEIAHELDAVLAHVGQSLEAFQIIRQTGWPVVNEFWTRGVFWRDHVRRMPHNAYTTTDRLRNEMRRTGLDRPAALPRPAGAAAVEASGAPAARVEIAFLEPFAARFEYDPAGGRYVRMQGGAPQRDAATGEVVAARALILQIVTATPIVFPWGEEGVRMPLVGRGRALLLVGGVAVDGQWQKAGLDAPTGFLDARGRAIRLPGNPVWVVLVPSTVAVHLRP